jgi:hypothetical protein
MHALCIIVFSLLHPRGLDQINRVLIGILIIISAKEE